MASVTGAAIDAGVTGEVTQLPLVALYALAVCGGIRKMSPLVQWGEVQSSRSPAQQIAAAANSYIPR